MSREKDHKAPANLDDDEAPWYDEIDLETVTMGAVEFQRPRWFESALAHLVREFFPDTWRFRDVRDRRAWRVALGACGIPGDPKARRHIPRSEISAAVGRKLGVDPSPYDPADLRASFGEVLVEFALYDVMLDRHEEAGDMCAVIDTAIRLGGLFEWWRWRREGYDRQAVSRQGSDRGAEKMRAGGANENEERAYTRRQWEAWAKNRAQELKAKNERRTKQKLGELIREEIGTREARASIIGDCGHRPDEPRRFCFVCTPPKASTIANRI